MFLRGGFFSDPDNNIRFTRKNPNIPAILFRRSFFPRGDDDFHYTFGMGTFINKIQLDGAANLARDSEELIFSLVYHF